jgi:hypothetical protein
MTKPLQLSFTRSNLAKDFDNDLDVHQGNGTAEIFQNNSSVLPFQLMEKTITLSRKKPLI